MGSAGSWRGQRQGGRGVTTTARSMPYLAGVWGQRPHDPKQWAGSLAWSGGSPLFRADQSTPCRADCLPGPSGPPDGPYLSAPGGSGQWAFAVFGNGSLPGGGLIERTSATFLQ